MSSQYHKTFIEAKAREITDGFIVDVVRDEIGRLTLPVPIPPEVLETFTAFKLAVMEKIVDGAGDIMTPRQNVREALFKWLAPEDVEGPLYYDPPTPCPAQPGEDAEVYGGCPELGLVFD